MDVLNRNLINGFLKGWQKKTKRSDKQQDVQHMNYAAQNYTDFIGTKASSGFALEDEDDTNVYQDAYFWQKRSW